MTTDQVRFVDPSGTPVPLEEIPPRLFSEVMRDVDLFVGVASIGADPTWSDRGGAFGGYWQTFAFGELGEAARNRRSILASLLPRLAIRDRCSLGERFLTVRGERATYEIHLGSGNIQIQPGSRYLCIVPSGRSSADEVFLPFEGDRMLAVILSKAFLLANDRKITDPTILSQIPS